MVLHPPRQTGKLVAVMIIYKSFRELVGFLFCTTTVVNESDDQVIIWRFSSAIIIIGTIYLENAY